MAFKMKRFNHELCFCVRFVSIKYKAVDITEEVKTISLFKNLPIKMIPDFHQIACL